MILYDLRNKLYLTNKKPYYTLNTIRIRDVN